MILAVGVVVGVVLIQQNQDIRKKASSNAVTCQQGFSDDFSSGSLDVSNWSTLFVTDNATLSFEQERVNVSLNPSSEPESVYFDTFSPYSGDFVADLDSNNLVAENEVTGIVSGVNFAAFEIDSGTVALVERVTYPGGQNLASYDADEYLSVEVSESDLVTVRLKRTGNILETYYRLNGGNFELLKTYNNFPVGEVKVSVSFYNYAATPEGFDAYPTVQASVDNFVLTCPEGFTGGGATSPNSSIPPFLKDYPFGKPPGAPGYVESPQRDELIEKILERERTN